MLGELFMTIDEGLTQRRQGQGQAGRTDVSTVFPLHSTFIWSHIETAWLQIRPQPAKGVRFVCWPAMERERLSAPTYAHARA